MALFGLIAALIYSGMFLTTLHCSNWCVSSSYKFHLVFLVSTSIPHLSHTCSIGSWFWTLKVKLNFLVHCCCSSVWLSYHLSWEMSYFLNTVQGVIYTFPAHVLKIFRTGAEKFIEMLACTALAGITLFSSGNGHMFYLWRLLILYLACMITWFIIIFEGELWTQCGCIS